ncbi:MAG: acyloxyacyl hydrolase [Methylacidiphilales bacterium]|nr:acyloxyacyl hydrolase [Candidatus Methylacidiphilales bacterium]
MVTLQLVREMNDAVLPGRKPGKLGVSLTCLALVMAFSFSRAFAGTDMNEITPPACNSEKDWTIEIASGVAWSNVRDAPPVKPYELVPINLTASLKLDEVGLDNFLGGWLRGYSEFYFSGEYQQIVYGPENHFEGLMVGPRYNFVQPGWKIIPYIEGGVGFGFADADPMHGGLGQDFNFTFDTAAGIRYNFNGDFFMRLAVVYQHISNAGMSEPVNPNNPIDELGPKISFGYSF